MHWTQMVAPAQKRKIVKKRTLRFTRMQSDRVAHVEPSWRRPKGIDCVVRRRFKDIWRVPKIGYGSNKKVLPGPCLVCYACAACEHAACEHAACEHAACEHADCSLEWTAASVCLMSCQLPGSAAIDSCETVCRRMVCLTRSCAPPFALPPPRLHRRST